MKARFAILMVAVLGMGGVALWRTSVADHAEEEARLTTEATDGMRALNQADADLQNWFPNAVSVLTTRLSVVNDIPGARDMVARDIVPRLDKYLAIGDRAVTTADAFMAVHPAPELLPQIDKIRKRITGMHDVRATFATIAAELSGDAGAVDVDKILQQLTGAGTRLLLTQ
jgi:hypothetical protein